MKDSQGVAGCASIAMVLAGILGGVACHEGTAAKASAAGGEACARTSVDSLQPVPIAAAAKGKLYRLTFVRSTDIAMRDPSQPNDSRLVLTLVAVNPGRP
jgi:hypothetical protein